MKTLLRYIINRIVFLIPVLFVVVLVSFFLIHLLPGDPALAMLGADASSQDVEALRQRLGLDRPLHVQFLSWLYNLMQGNLGNSITSGRPVIHHIQERLLTSFLLNGFALAISLFIALPSSIISAYFKGTFIDQTVRVVSLIGLSVPIFWSGIMGMLLFGVIWGVLPVSGFVSIVDNFWGGIRYMILPSVALGFYSSAIITRMGRSSLLEVLRLDYIRTARAKGLREQTVILRHALKNAMLPIITLIGINIGSMLGGTVVVETVFALPGVGRLVVFSIYNRDYPVVQGVLLLLTLFYISVNLIIDLAYVYIDPRIKYS